MTSYATGAWPGGSMVSSEKEINMINVKKFTKICKVSFCNP